MIVYRSNECTVGTAPAEDVPARVVYLTENRVFVTHELGDDHVNARLARQRLASRGYRVLMTRPRDRTTGSPTGSPDATGSGPTSVALQESHV